MFRINVLTGGKYNNVVLGYRYCIRKRTAYKLVKQFKQCDCCVEIHKLIHIHSDIFCWSEYDIEI